MRLPVDGHVPDLPIEDIGGGIGQFFGGRRQGIGIRRLGPFGNGPTRGEETAEKAKKGKRLFQINRNAAEFAGAQVAGQRVRQEGAFVKGFLAGGIPQTISLGRSGPCQVFFRPGLRYTTQVRSKQLEAKSVFARIHRSS